MQFRIPCEDYQSTVTAPDRKLIDRHIQTALSGSFMGTPENESLPLACLPALADVSSAGRESENEMVYCSFWNVLTSNHPNLKDTLARSNSNLLYAHQQLLTQLMTQNSSMKDYSIKLDNIHHQIVLRTTLTQFEANAQLRSVCLRLLQLDHVEKELSDLTDCKDAELNSVLCRCSQCGFWVNRERSICPSCGHILHNQHPMLKTQPGQDLFRSDLEKISAALHESMSMNNHPSKKGNGLYLDQISQLERCLQQFDLPQQIQQSIQQHCKSTKRFLQQQHVEIAIAGSVKAGKSSLINALLDEEIAAVETTPETSVLTKYRTTRTGNYIHVQFYRDSDWKGIWSDACKSSTYLRDYQQTNAAHYKEKWVNAKPYHRNQLTLEELKAEVYRFTHSKSPDHFFVREVEVGICSKVFPGDVFLVDTPGLDDIVRARSAVTRRYLGKAGAVLACVKADSLHESSEAQFISRVMGNRLDRNTLFVVVTKKDTKSAENFEKDYQYFLRNVLDEMFNPDEKSSPRIHAADNCFGISAQRCNDLRTFEHNQLGDSSTNRYRDFLSFLFSNGYLDLFALADPDAVRNNILRNAATIREYSGIPQLKEQLHKRFIYSVREQNQQIADAKFAKFHQNLKILLANHMSSLKDQLQPLNADEAELIQMREHLKNAERARQELQEAIAAMKNGGIR